MNRHQLKKLDRALSSYVERMFEGLGRPERRRAMGLYISGLLLDGERKSIVPMASRLSEEDVSPEAMRQRLQEAVTYSDWAEQCVYERVARQLHEQLPEIEAYVIDDTGFAKKGNKSVGVSRQYSGTLGRVDNCQVAVSLHLAGNQGSGCIGMRLFLPESWTNDPARRIEAKIPEEVVFRKKWELALEQLDQALGWGQSKHVVLADAGYGDCPEFRDGLVERGLHYVVGIAGSHRVWPPGVKLAIPTRIAGPGRPPTRVIAKKAKPVAIEELAGEQSYRTITWREGTKGKMKSRFAVARIQTAMQFEKGRPPGDVQWLLCEWPDGEKHPTKFYLSNLPANTSVKELVRTTKLRWRVERDYQDMKGELGLDHFEGRTWRGFHHHAALCAVAHGFLALQRALFPPEQEMDAA